MNTSVQKNSNLPLDKFPEWLNDDRMNALFAPFRKASSNDQDNISKINFWTRFIHEYVKNKKSSIITLLELEDGLERNNSKPKCLQDVLLHMIKSEELCPESIFMQSTQKKAWGPWLLQTFFKSPSSALYSHFKSYIITNTISKDEIIVDVQYVKVLGNAVLNKLNSENINKCLTLKEFMQLFEDNVDENTARHVLIWLTKNEKAKFYPPDPRTPPTLIKLSRHCAQDIKENEITFEILVQKELFLCKEIQNLEIKHDDALDKAKECLKNGRRVIAKSHLKKKKEIERLIDNRCNVLANVETMIMRIQDVTINKEIVDGFAIAANILKQHEKQINEKDVTQLQDNLHECLSRVKEMEETVSEPISLGSDDDLEKELEDLMNEKEPEPEIKAKETTLDLPDLSQLNLKDLTISPEPNNSPSQSSMYKED